MNVWDNLFKKKKSQFNIEISENVMAQLNVFRVQKQTIVILHILYILDYFKHSWRFLVILDILGHFLFSYTFL